MLSAVKITKDSVGFRAIKQFKGFFSFKLNLIENIAAAKWKQLEYAQINWQLHRFIMFN